MLATNRHVCQEVRHMTSHSLNGQGAAEAAAAIDLDPAATLARMLRNARVAAGYTSQDALARDLNVDRSVVTKAESGNRFPSDKVLLKWCEVCHLDPGQVLAKARKARKPDGAIPPWFETFREVELVAHTVRVWHPILIPGPLQIPDYARALFEGMGESVDRIGELVAARIDLQQILIRPEPATLWAVMDEAVLRRQVGSDEVMHRQLTHLIEQGQRSHIGIQVVPAIRGANAGCVGAFTIASIEGAPDVLLKEAVEDVTTDKQGVLRKAHTIFDRVRLDALSGPQSLELIAKVAKECKP
jgi:transcriptional regulator with XRE-family HTH domain